MSLDKKQIALSVGGILAGLTLTYILYRRGIQQKASADSEASNTPMVGTSLNTLPYLPPISVPSLNVPSQGDTVNQGGQSSGDSGLAAIIAAMQAAIDAANAANNSNPTNTSNPNGNAGADQTIPPYIPPSYDPVIMPVILPTQPAPVYNPPVYQQTPVVTPSTPEQQAVTSDPNFHNITNVTNPLPTIHPIGGGLAHTAN